VIWRKFCTKRQSADHRHLPAPGCLSPAQARQDDVPGARASRVRAQPLILREREGAGSRAEAIEKLATIGVAIHLATRSLAAARFFGKKAGSRA
jgi:hypothetical protein